MLLYDKRKKLADLFTEWWMKNKVADTPFNVIGYLEGHGLLNEEKVLEFLEKAEKEDVD